MCGIAGVQLLDGKTVDPAVCHAMAAALHHRGPDDAGITVDGPVGIAHARLSIVDPSPAGHQPFADARHVLSFNGEIYNAPDLRRELERAGQQFVGTSDTEVLFHLLSREGLDEALRRIEGMYAFSWSDRAEGAVWLCRDPLGIKPCVWSSRPDGVYWASVVAGLRAAIPVRPHPVRTLGAVLGRGETATEGTMFEGVHQVPPGGVVELRGGKVVGEWLHRQLTDWIDPSYVDDLDSLTFEATVTEFERLLAEAVERVLLSDVPLGSFVSGGVDSSLLAALVCRLDPDHSLFTADVVGRYSEAHQAKQVGALLGSEVSVARFDPESIIDDWAVATLHHESPIVTHVNSLPFRRVAERAAGDGVKAVLTGEGADELFLGYPPVAFNRYAKVLGAPLRGVIRAYGSVPKLLEKAAPDLDQRQPVFLAALSDDLSSERVHREALEAFAFMGPARAADQALTLDHLQRHLLTLLHRNDRMGMAAGVEARFPYLDERLVRFGINLPYRCKIRTSGRVHDRKHPFQVDKGIVRAAASRLLPEEVANRRKDGFPMYGHLNVVCDAGLFNGGYVQDLAGLSSAGVAELVDHVEPYYVAKLASVEVFGRLFAMDHDPEQITEHLRDHTRVVV